METFYVTYDDLYNFSVGGTGINNPQVSKKLIEMGGRLAQDTKGNQFISFDRLKIDNVITYIESLIFMKSLTYNIAAPYLKQRVIVNNNYYRVVEIQARDIIKIKSISDDKIIQAAVVAGKWRTLPDLIELKF